MASRGINYVSTKSFILEENWITNVKHHTHIDKSREK
jgi:hypothetical protein